MKTHNTEWFICKVVRNGSCKSNHFWAVFWKMSRYLLANEFGRGKQTILDVISLLFFKYWFNTSCTNHYDTDARDTLNQNSTTSIKCIVWWSASRGNWKGRGTESWGYGRGKAQIMRFSICNKEFGLHLSNSTWGLVEIIKIRDRDLE